MNSRSFNNNGMQGRRGVVLLVTLVLLVVLSTLGYTLSSRVSAQLHRQQYMIDYQAARYGCDSAVKYALATLEDINNPKLIERPDEPDFSDLFTLSEQEYQELLAQWAEIIRAREETFDDSSSTNTIKEVNETNDINDINDANDINDVGFEETGAEDSNDPNTVKIRGPYGPPWPFITEPIEFEIGNTKVKIEIEDENAKYPIGWAMLGDETVQREATAGFATFCEWMKINEEEIESLKEQLQQISKIRPFKVEFKETTTTRREIVRTTTTDRRQRSRRPQYKTVKTTISAFNQVAAQASGVAKLLHSSLIDVDLLARPTIISDRRKESALKYMGMWGSSKVNINSAPRQVLEAAFVFGGNEVKIAEEIIRRRRIKPFESIGELKESLFRYSESIRKCEKYITTTSDFFTIKVTAISGMAKTSTVIAIAKDGNNLRRVAVISG